MEPFKNNLSKELVCCIANQLAKHLDRFDEDRFVSRIGPALDELELKERSQCIADELHRVLPKELNERYRILLAMLHPLEDTENALQSDENGIRGWGMLPLCSVVGQHGLEDFDVSLATLKEMTKRFSSEFDVRHFLLADQDRTLAIMAGWLQDPNRHVRRLVSEGTRPRLPWAMKLPQLIANPSPVLPLLEALRDDEEEYVRRSVANHLNDISKDHPDLIAQLAREWMQPENRQRTKLLRHACRGLIKQGHPIALEVFGYESPKLSLEKLTIKTPIVVLGNALQFVARIQSHSNCEQPLIIDYVIHHQKNNGGLTAKVFKWKTASLSPHGELLIDRTHKIRPVTTRRYYTGKHALSLRINGQDFGYKEFHLECQMLSSAYSPNPAERTVGCTS